MIGRPGVSQADAKRLPFPTAYFDRVLMFDVVEHLFPWELGQSLAEIRRVLKPGGRFLCLEFSTPQLGGLDRLYEAYSFTVVPWLGQQVAGDRAAYQYLVESIRRFPDQATFARLIERAGLARVRFRNLSGGIAALHSAWRL